jgi:DNA-binding NarL/FixJ family response regulator
MSFEPIRVLLVDDHKVVRNGLRMMLSVYSDIAVVAEAADANEAMQCLREREVDVVLCDIGLPGRSGLDLLKMIKAQWPKLAVLILTMYQEDMYAVRAVKQGAAGYLTKDATEEVLAAAIRKAASGGRYMTPTVAEKLAGAIGGAADRPAHETLSEREFQVLRLIAQGESLNDIAEALTISAKTVTGYRRRVLDKLGLTSNAQLTRYALEHGLLD